MNGLSDISPELNGPQQPAEHEPPQIRRPTPSLGRWGLFKHRSRTRRCLLKLDEQQLCDIGLSREQARHEGLKPFWRS